MPTHRVTLEMTKSNLGPTPIIEVRVGDADQWLEVTLLEDGLPYRPPENAVILFQAKRKDGGLTRSLPMTKVTDPNVWKCEIPAQSFAYHGVSKEAFVAVYRGDDPGPTSQTLQLVVLPGTTDEEAVRYFDAEINRLKNTVTDAEDSRQEAEQKRADAEKAREAAEQKRVSEESARANAESERDTAEKARVQAETTRRGDEETRQEQEQARQTAEQKRAEAEVERGNAEQDRDTAETARADAESKRKAAEQGRVDAEASRVGAETDRETAEDARDEAEQKRVAAEEKRVEAESGRETAEGKRVSAEETRQSQESERVEAETARAEAETKRSDAETARGEAEQGRVTADADRAERQDDNDARQDANDEAQSKNNADQQQNNLAAQGRLTRILQEGEYDPETREPTIEGDLTHVFAVPTKESEVAAAALETAKADLKRVEREMADAAGEGPSFDGQVTKAQSALEAAQIAYEAANRYVEWLWLLDGDGQGYWELYGSGNSTLPDPVSTEEIDRMWDGETVETKHVAYSSGVAYDITKTKSAIADAISAHDTNLKEWVQSTSKAKDAEHADKASSAETAGTADKLGSETVGSATEPIYLNEGTATAIPKVGKASVADKLGTATVGSEKQPIYLKDGVPTPGGAEIDLVTKEAAGIVPPLPEDASLEKGYALGWSDEGKAVWIEAKGEAQLPDPRELRALIESSNTKKSGAKVKGSGDYTFGTQVTTQEAIDAFGKAIDAAQAVSDEYYSQKELDEATEALRQANSTFDATLTALAPDKSGLTSEESRYTQLKNGVSVSTNGKDIAFGGKWVTASEQSAADTAITTARNAVNAATKQSEITTAVSTFKSAVDTYSSAIKTATKDTSALESAITAANKAKTDVQTSETEGSDLPSGSKYVTAAQMKALADAISAAETAKTSAANQNEIDTATSKLQTATSTFNGQIKTNWTAPENISGASWEDIEKLSAMAAESPQDYSKYLGQTKEITLSGISGVSKVTVMVIGIGQDVDPQGKKLGFTFQLRDGLEYNQPVNMTMNASAVTTGGWRDSLMRSTNLPKIEAALPADLKSRLKTMVKKTNITTSGSTMTETQDKLALLSCVEVFGPTQSNYGSNQSGFQTWYPLEGEWYQWYQQHNTDSDRIIKRASGSAYVWWLRSVQSSAYFARVYVSGGFDWDSAYGAYLPCACFSV